MKQRKKSFGMRISAFVLSFAMVCTLLAGVNVVAFAADDNDLIVSVHCFYNDATKGGDGEHLYTKDLDEMSWLSSLPTWNDEDEAWKAPVSSSLAVYRVYNPNSGEHHYAAADEAEWLVSQGWTQEKIAFYSDDNMGVPIYRLWNGGEGVGSHYYTTDEGEAAYLASIGWTAEGVNFYGVKEEGEKQMTAAQSGSKEITVTTESEFTGLEEFTVLKGAVEQSVASVEFSSDMTFATLTMDGNIAEAEYTVICSDEDYEPAYFEGEVGELTHIFIGENLIYMGQQEAASGAAISVYAVGYKTVDQWFNDYSVSSFDSQICSAGTVLSVKDGMMTIGTAQPLTIGTQQTVSLVKGTVVGTQTVTVSATSVVADMTVGELTPTDAEALINTTGRIDVEDVNADNRYYFPVYALDQYGNELNAKLLNTMVASGSLIVTPDGTATSGVLKTVGTQAGANIFSELDDGTVVMFVEGDGTSYGAALINLVSTSGEVAAATDYIDQNERIEEITFITAEPSLQSGKAVGAMVLAENNYGEEVDMYNEVEIDPSSTAGALPGTYSNIVFKYTPENGRASESKSHISLTNAVIGYEDDAATETRVFGVVGLNSAQSATITIYSANGTKVTPLVYTVAKAATPDAIKGLTDSAAKTKTTFATVGDTINVALTDLVFIDSDGDVIAQDKQAQNGIIDLVANDASTAATTDQYYVLATSADGKIGITGNDGVTLNSTGTTAGKTYKVTYSLCKKTATGKNVVAEKSISYKVFNANDANMIYTTQIKSQAGLDKYMIYAGEYAYLAEDTAIIQLYQTDSNGATVPMNVTGVSVSGGNFTTAVTGSAIGVDVATITALEEMKEMGTATINIFATVGTVDKKVATTSLVYDVTAPAAISAVVLDADKNPVDKTSFSNVTAISLYAPGIAMVQETNNAVNKVYTLFVVDQYSNIDVDADWTFNGKALPNGAPTQNGVLSVEEDGVSQDWTITIPA